MGVLNDYFRAPDDDTASAIGRRIGGPLVPAAGVEPPLDGIAAKGIDAPVVLGKLIALRRAGAWHPGILDNEPVYPTGPRPTAESFASFPADSPWFNGPWVERLGDAARDDLTGIGHGELDALAARWAAIEEFGGRMDGALLAGVLRELVALASRARSAGDHLYCWSSL